MSLKIMEIGVSDFIKALSKVKSLHWDPYLIEVKHFFFFGFIFYYYKWLNTSSWTSNNIVVVQCLHNATGSIDSNLPMFHNLTFLNFHVNSCRWLPHFAVLVFHKICYAQMMKCLFIFWMIKVTTVSSVVRKTSFVIVFRKMLTSLKGEKSLMRQAHERPAPLKGSSLTTFLYIYHWKTFHFVGLKRVHVWARICWTYP